MTEQEFQERVEQVRAMGVEVDRPVQSWQGLTFGDRVAVLEDDEDRGLFAGTEGIVVIEHVGSVEHRNQRIALVYVEDGMDAGEEVSADEIEAL